MHVCWIPGRSETKIWVCYGLKLGDLEMTDADRSEKITRRRQKTSSAITYIKIYYTYILCLFVYVLLYLSCFIHIYIYTCMYTYILCLFVYLLLHLLCLIHIYIYIHVCILAKRKQLEVTNERECARAPLYFFSTARSS